MIALGKHYIYAAEYICAFGFLPSTKTKRNSYKQAV
jgi:hypothetical protein